MGLFIGCGEYLTTFVAQYHGARRPERIGPAVWQGVYFSLLAGGLVAALRPLLRAVFTWAGHAPAVLEHEVTYAGILMVGALPVVLMATLSTFFTGRGQTKLVLLVNVLVTLVNGILDYLWIFGKAGFPRAGVAGAAWATVCSQVVGALVYLGFILAPDARRTYATLSGWRFERGLFARLLRYGLPTGLQFCTEVAAFAAFMLIVGRISTTALAASSIAFNLNLIVFMPLLAMGIAVSALVGRYLGAERPAAAERATWSAFRLGTAYMALCGAGYVLAPRLLVMPYAAGSPGADFAPVADLTVVLLRFVALYSIFDAMNVIFAGGLKGAGDTAFTMWVTVCLAWGVMLVPGFVACVLLGGGVYVAWTTATAYVVLLGLLMRRRFAAGGWKALRVIEAAAG
jgi:MATE family multidrug resistance protein